MQRNTLPPLTEQSLHTTLHPKVKIQKLIFESRWDSARALRPAALRLVRIHQARHECQCTTLFMQANSLPIQGGNQDLLYRPFRKIRLWACTSKQEPPLYLVSCPAGPTLIVQTLSGYISPFFWVQKWAPARILAGQSESRSFVIVRKSWKSREKQTI